MEVSNTLLYFDTNASVRRLLFHLLKKLPSESLASDKRVIGRHRVSARMHTLRETRGQNVLSMICLVLKLRVKSLNTSAKKKGNTHNSVS